MGNAIKSYLATYCMSSISILVLTTLSSAMTGYSTVSSTLYSSMPVKWAGMI